MRRVRRLQRIELRGGVMIDNGILTGPRRVASPTDTTLIVEAGPVEIVAYQRLRREVFVDEQALFDRHDRDHHDDDDRTVVLVARTAEGTVVGGVRLHPAHGGPDIGWWRGSRLAVAPGARHRSGIGAALVRAACARAEAAGALRFDATIQAQNEPLFTRLGWQRRATVDLHGRPHVVVDWPIGRVQRLVDATKSALGDLLAGVVAQGPATDGWRGDDGAPVPGSDLVAACDAIVPAMVERDPEWAGWCSVLVNVNDLSAMGARPVGLLDAVAARDASFARRILGGLRAASAAWDVPVLGGHTQLGAPAALSVTALGRTDRPVPGGGGSVGEAVRLTADLIGGWRSGYTGTQWDSTSHRSREDLQQLGSLVGRLAPSAAKDVSMSGVVGTTGMLAEASGCRAVLDVAAIPSPAGTTTGDWLTCFPGFAVLTSEPRHAPAPDLPRGAATAVAGELTSGSGVGLRWPDGVVTDAVTSTVTGMGTA